MAKFKVVITEWLERVVEVESNSEFNAVNLVREMYLKSDVVLSADDFSSYDIEIQKSDLETNE